MSDTIERELPDQAAREFQAEGMDMVVVPRVLREIADFVEATRAYVSTITYTNEWAASGDLLHVFTLHYTGAS